LSTTSLAAAVTFGDLLRQLRRRAGLTQGELATLVGFSVAQISRLEQNQRLPDLTVIAEQVAPALGLQAEPRLVHRLLELAAAARGEGPPPALKVTRAVQTTIQEQVVEVESSLPNPPTALIGRERTLRALSKRLIEAPGRLVTLVGPPGVGKTRLALAAATQIQDFFAHGAQFVPLAAISDPDLVTSALVAHLGLTEGSAKPPLTRLVENLRRKELLLVLDNFEQVRGAAPLVAQLLAECGGLRLLVTSREPLRLRSEQRFKIPPLEPAAAVELFLQRAEAINPDFAVTPEQGGQITQICLLLDCLPLAIELAAARSELFTPAQLLHGLQQGRLALLDAGAPDLPERHRTLRNAIAWSYHLLAPEAQWLLRLLSVFVGGFDLDTLRGTLSDWPVGHGVKSEELSMWLSAHQQKDENQPQRTDFSPLAIRNSLFSQECLLTDLQTLIASSLLVQQEVDGNRRYTLLETIREFALEQSTLHGEIYHARRRHAYYFADWATVEIQRSFEREEGVWWQRLEQEQENLRAALHWLLQSDGEQALGLAIALYPFWDTRGHQNEGSRWLAQALALNPAPTVLRAQGLLKAGSFAQQRMDFQPSAQLLDEALALFRSADDTAGEAETLRAWGWLASNMGDPDRARHCFEASLALFRRLNNQRMVATVLSNLVHVLTYSAATYEQTRAYAEESLALFRALGDEHGIALALRQLGVYETQIGNYTAAAAACQEAMTIWQRRGSKRELVWTMEMLGEAYWLLGEVATAANLWQEAFHHFQSMAEEFGMMVLCHHLGQVTRVRGNLAEAVHYYVRSLRYFWKLDTLYFVSRCLAGLGGVALARDNTEAAAQLLAAAFRLFGALPPFLAPGDQEEYDHLVANTRHALGEAAFERLCRPSRRLR
jgi:predicted ATPase/transcriptional regulator with XRE-family HTH domain